MRSVIPPARKYPLGPMATFTNDKERALVLAVEKVVLLKTKVDERTDDEMETKVVSG